MTTPYRLTAARIRTVVAALSPRERDVVRSLHRVRLATADQLRRLHFTEGPAVASARHVRRTLKSLRQRRVLTLLDRRVGGPTGGSTARVYGLDVVGQAVVRDDGARMRRPWEPAPMFVRHALWVTELYVQLREAERQGRLRLLDFQAEPRCWRSFFDVGGVPSILKADAYVTLQVGRHRDTWLVEIDLGTHSLASLRRKFDLHNRYLTSGQGVTEDGVHPRVLWLVENDRRRRQLIDIAAHQPGPAWELHRVALLEDAVGCFERGAA